VTDELHVAKLHLRSALADVAALPAYGSRWQPHMDKIYSAISELTSARQALHYAQREITFDHRTSVQAELPYLSWYDREVKAEFPWFANALDRMGDNPESIGESLTPDRGRLISNIFFYHARIVFECLTHVPAPKNVVEIGGGYGGTARLWLTNALHKPRSYIVVDAPESLFFCEAALRAEFGSLVTYAGEQPWNGNGVLLVPLSRLNILSEIEIDLVVNTCSMQEMTDEWIDFYMEWLDRKSPGAFYSLNYAAQPLNNLGESRNLWGPRPSPLWAPRVFHFDPALMRMQGSERSWLVALYERELSHVNPGEVVRLRRMRMTRDVYAQWIDLIRRTLDAGLMAELIRRVENEMHYWPKETLWIVRRLMNTEYHDEFSWLLDRLTQLKGGFV
jgi:putative sugar O-methyltransferase